MQLKRVCLLDRAISLIDSYLTNRKQYTKISDFLSESGTSQYGIPQGTVIGPILFIIYVNDMFELPLRGKIISYADDTVLIEDGNSWEVVTCRAIEDINTLKEWFSVNLLSLNISKTACLPFSINSTGIPTTLKVVIQGGTCESDNGNNECIEVKVVDSIKYLGLTLDQHMKWKNHLESLNKRLRKLIYVFLELRNFLNIHKLKNVYFALAQSLLQYGIVAWGGAYPTTLKSLSITQRSILKIMMGKPRDYPTKQLFNDIKVLTVEQLYKRDALLQTYKEKSRLISQQGSKILRAINYLPTPLCKRDLAQRHYTYQGVKFFNHLPPQIREITCRDQFKRELKRLIVKGGVW
jgi:hypothetical protein